MISEVLNQLIDRESLRHAKRNPPKHSSVWIVLRCSFSGGEWSTRSTITVYLKQCISGSYWAYRVQHCDTSDSSPIWWGLHSTVKALWFMLVKHCGHGQRLINTGKVTVNIHTLEISPSHTLTNLGQLGQRLNITIKHNNFTQEGIIQQNRIF